MDIEKILEAEGQAQAPAPAVENESPVETNPHVDEAQSEAPAPEVENTEKPKKPNGDFIPQKRLDKEVRKRKEAQERLSQADETISTLKARLEELEKPSSAPKLEREDFGEGQEAEIKYRQHEKQTLKEEILKDVEKEQLQKEIKNIGEQTEQVKAQITNERQQEWAEALQNEVNSDPSFLENVNNSRVNWDELRPALQQFPNEIGIEVAKEIAQNPRAQQMLNFANGNGQVLQNHINLIVSGVLNKPIEHQQPESKPQPIPTNTHGSTASKKKSLDDYSFNDIDKQLFNRVK